MNLLCRFIGLAIFASANFLPFQNLLAQLPDLTATATINFGDGNVVNATSRRGSFDRVGLLPSQVVSVTVQLPLTKAGDTITIEPLDGGSVIGPSNQAVVAADGTFSFTFQGGQDPGVCQVSLHDGTQEMGLQFWVLNQQNPQENPPVINSTN